MHTAFTPTFTQERPMTDGGIVYSNHAQIARPIGSISDGYRSHIDPSVHAIRVYSIVKPNSRAYHTYIGLPSSKTIVSPMLTHWRYNSFALKQRYVSTDAF